MCRIKESKIIINNFLVSKFDKHSSGISILELLKKLKDARSEKKHEAQD